MTPRLPLLAVAGAAALALTGCGASPAAEPAAAVGTTAAAAGTTAAAPAPTRTADSPAPTVAVSAPPRRTDDGCPVTAAALQRVVRMPAGWRIKGLSIAR